MAFLTRMLYFILDCILYMTKFFLTNVVFDVNYHSIYGADFDETCSSAGFVSSSRDYIRLFVWFLLLVSCVYLSMKNKTLHSPTLSILIFSISYKLSGGPLFFDPMGRNCSLILEKATNTNMFVNMIVLTSSFMTLSFFI